MRKRTSVDLDLDIVDQAAKALGTRDIGVTVRAALAEVILIRRRQKLLEPTTDLGLDELKRVRTTRSGRAAPRRIAAP